MPNKPHTAERMADMPCETGQPEPALGPLNRSTGHQEPARIEPLRFQWLGLSSMLGFAVLWFVFYGIFQTFPYLSEGSEVIYRAKVDQEFHGTIFPRGAAASRLLMFGTSTTLAGFIPAHFDGLAEVDGLSVFSYNSGYPGRSEFVPQLTKIVQNKSNIPDIVLLTVPWAPSENARGLFRPFSDDHKIADLLFPFRHLLRDSLSFLVTSREHGGPAAFYRESGLNVSRMLQDRGYYFISEQSHYPHNRLPDNFRLGSDRPDYVYFRTADAGSSELSQLNSIIERNHIQCFFVPDYQREGKVAPAPEVDRPFAELLQHHTSCKVLGPDYYLLPNRMFSDQTHLNPEGAKVYTEAIYRLVVNQVLGR